MTQEALRRVRNTNTGVEAQNKHLSLFMAKLRKSGYSRKFRAEIIHRTKTAYEKILENDRNGIIPLYRDRKTLEKLKRERES